MRRGGYQQQHIDPYGSSSGGGYVNGGVAASSTRAPPSAGVKASGKMGTTGGSSRVLYSSVPPSISSSGVGAAKGSSSTARRTGSRRPPVSATTSSSRAKPTQALPQPQTSYTPGSTCVCDGPMVELDAWDLQLSEELSTARRRNTPTGVLLGGKQPSPTEAISALFGSASKTPVVGGDDGVHALNGTSRVLRPAGSSVTGPASPPLPDSRAAVDGTPSSVQAGFSSSPVQGMTTGGAAAAAEWPGTADVPSLSTSRSPPHNLPQQGGAGEGPTSALGEVPPAAAVLSSLADQQRVVASPSAPGEVEPSISSTTPTTSGTSIPLEGAPPLPANLTLKERIKMLVQYGICNAPTRGVRRPIPSIPGASSAAGIGGATSTSTSSKVRSPSDAAHGNNSQPAIGPHTLTQARLREARLQRKAAQRQAAHRGEDPVGSRSAAQQQAQPPDPQRRTERWSTKSDRSRTTVGSLVREVVMSRPLDAGVTDELRRALQQRPGNPLAGECLRQEGAVDRSSSRRRSASQGGAKATKRKDHKATARSNAATKCSVDEERMQEVAEVLESEVATAHSGATATTEREGSLPCNGSAKFSSDSFGSYATTNGSISTSPSWHTGPAQRRHDEIRWDDGNTFLPLDNRPQAAQIHDGGAGVGPTHYRLQHQHQQQGRYLKEGGLPATAVLSYGGGVYPIAKQ